MPHWVSAKCDTVIDRAIQQEPRSACRQPGLAWGNPAIRKVQSGLQTWLAHALLCGKHQADHTDSRSWTSSRPNSRNAGSPTGRVRPMVGQWSDMRTSRRRPRNRKRSTSWPNACPPRGASFRIRRNRTDLHTCRRAAGPNSNRSATTASVDRSPLPAIFLPAGFFFVR
jgi:hypothetical protein